MKRSTQASPRRGRAARPPMSPQEAALFNALVLLTTRDGQPPTRDELAEVIGCVRSGNTHRLVAGLIQKGWVRNVRRERGLVAVRGPNVLVRRGQGPATAGEDN